MSPLSTKVKKEVDLSNYRQSDDLQQWEMHTLYSTIKGSD